MITSKKIAQVQKGCVACGTCVKECTLGVIYIYKGLYAKTDTSKCVGCGKCGKICPASVIDIVLRGEE